MAQTALDASLAELSTLQATSKSTGTKDEDAALMIEMMNAIEMNQAESNVRRAKLQLENAQNHLMSALEHKRILDLIQNLSLANHGKSPKPYNFFESWIEL